MGSMLCYQKQLQQNVHVSFHVQMWVFEEGFVFVVLESLINKTHTLHYILQHGTQWIIIYFWNNALLFWEWTIER